MIPTTILTKNKRPQHHKPEIIRAIGYRQNSSGHLVEDHTYKGRRCLQLITCKYSTDNNILDTITNIHSIYEPLKQALMKHSKKRLQVQIVSIVISRTCNFYTNTLATIAQVILFIEHPPDVPIYKKLPKQAQKIAITLHVRAQAWLTLVSKVSRSTLSHPRRPSRNAT
jgi:hypothetical protein